MTEHHEPEGYDGPAEVLTDRGPVEVTVTVRGAFQPIDGRYHWYGRVVHERRLDELGRAAADVVLRTPEGRAAGRLSDEDPWGRLRIAGTGRPPYRCRPDHRPQRGHTPPGVLPRPRRNMVQG